VIKSRRIKRAKVGKNSCEFLSKLGSSLQPGAHEKQGLALDQYTEFIALFATALIVNTGNTAWPAGPAIIQAISCRRRSPCHPSQGSMESDEIGLLDSRAATRYQSDTSALSNLSSTPHTSSQRTGSANRRRARKAYTGARALFSSQAFIWNYSY
jgi:hypothetical protein